MRGSRSRAAPDVDVVDVVLVDDDQDVAVDEVRAVLHELAVEAMARRATWAADLHAPPEPEVPVPDPSGAGTVRRVARRYRGRVVTGAVLALAVATTTAVVDARQSAARAAALAATPAVLVQASHAPAEVWRVPGRVASDQDDLLLVIDGTSLRAVDPATGAATWTASAAAGRAAATGRCFPVDEARTPGRTPVDDGSGAAALVACAADRSDGASAGDATAGTVVVLDQATGRTRHTIGVDGAPLLVEPVGRDLLVAAAMPDGRVRITRWDLATGTPRWDSVSPAPAVGGDGADLVERRPDSLTVGTFAVELVTGGVLDGQQETTEPHPVEEHRLSDGAQAVWSWRNGTTSGRGHVSGGSTGTAYALPGPPLRPAITDGDDAGVLVVRPAGRDRLRGLGLRSGRMSWTRPYPGASALRATALVDGVMLLDDGDTVTALDVRTGASVWQSAVAPLTGSTALTDGQVVLLPDPADDSTVRLVARRIADGTVVWQTEVPPGTGSLSVVDHHLVASTGDEVIGLG